VPLWIALKSGRRAGSRDPRKRRPPSQPAPCSALRLGDRTPGILRLIRFGEQPAKVPDHEIEAIEARADKLGIIRLPPPPPPKSRHVFKAGGRARQAMVASTGGGLEA
jgi:hypothetical protein